MADPRKRAAIYIRVSTTLRARDASGFEQNPEVQEVPLRRQRCEPIVPNICQACTRQSSPLPIFYDLLVSGFRPSMTAQTS